MALTQRQAALKHGWRSGLEEKVAASLEARGVVYAYESETLAWTPPSKPRKYTPDFLVWTDKQHAIYVETKGRWTREDRMKMLAVVEQHPDKDIRMVFQTPNAKIAKGSKTTYAQWCERKLGIPWAKGDVPDEWLRGG